ncbi:hypothetical protein AMJ47_03770 [Parcubacteria bacterium DG_72]|nr:MAG: hypothetical protein AMJ47_03770 [Parcubacteria bacterium DG_72]
MEMSLEEKNKRTREDLEDLEFYIKEFSDFLPLPVCAISPMGMVTDFNKAAEGLTGYLSFEIVGENLDKLFLEKEDLEKIEKEIRKEKSIHNKELTLIAKKGNEIPVNASISLRQDRDGNFIGYFLALFDITKIKNLQQDLERKVEERTQELRERLGELETFRKVTIGRELKIVELKNKIKELEAQLEKRA